MQVWYLDLQHYCAYFNLRAAQILMQISYISSYEMHLFVIDLFKAQQTKRTML